MSIAKKEKNMQGQQTSCRQCGICCTKGGAALHGADIDLLLQHKISRRDLITLRRGELAWNPVSNAVEPTQSEIVKLRGSGGEWTCCFFDSSTNACSIYDVRPVACRILKCWEPGESLALAGTDLLSRSMILQNEKELGELVERYEADFPLPDFSSLSSDMENHPEKIIATLENVINLDLEFRDAQVEKSAVVSAEELFLFGRPLFQLLQAVGFQVSQTGSRLCLQKRSG